jgi:hypothetical protein
MPGGEIVILPPFGAESGFRAVEAAATLHTWAKANKRGNAFGSSVQFFLPDGAALSPDAAGVSNERLATVSKHERRKFPHLTKPGKEMASPAPIPLTDYSPDGVDLTLTPARCLEFHERRWKIFWRSGN